MGSLEQSRPLHPATDPAVYDTHHQSFKRLPLPSNPDEWLQRAAHVSAILADDAALREKEKKSPIAEVSLLKSSGLTKVLGPRRFGGGDQGWSVAYKVIREVAKGDGSIGMLLGYHFLWSSTVNVVGTDEQKDRTQKLILENNFFVGGAVNPRDNDQKITDDGDHIIFSGFKNFNTGGVVSDLTVLEGVYESTDKHIFALVPSNQPGIVFSHNWDNIGLRLTESGSVKIDNVRVPWQDALGWNPTTKEPIAGILNIPWATLLLPTIQLVFSNFYIGIALGALSFAATYTTKHTRPWPYTPSPAPSATSEPYILARYGSFFAHLRAAESLADVAGAKIAELYTHSEKRDITAAQRGETAEWVASVKVVATETALRVTGGVFEMTGARATAGKVGLDRFWRDVRTHTLHDPVAYKEMELGRYVLLGQVPEPSWYT
ncbi:acyl-CoA dehydrogenase/oxidase [Usnea florida]